MKSTTFVGLDVHKEQIAVAITESGSRENAKALGSIPNTPEAIAKLVRKLGSPKHLHFCYEAGPCGYGLYRQLIRLGTECDVVAPTLIPTKPGERVKTDKRDAKKLARLHRGGELTAVWVPDEAHEALRDLVRARHDGKDDLQRHRNRLSKFLLRLDQRPPFGVKAWSVKYRQWLTGLTFDQTAQAIVLREYLHVVDETEARIKRIEDEMAELVQTSSMKPVVDALQALRGIAFISAATMVAEIGDIRRFDHPEQLMAYAGVVPSEYTSNDSKRQGSITKTGNAHLRYITVESAWHYRRKPAISANLRKRQEGLPETVKATAWKAQHRLNLKYRRLVSRGKMPQKAIVAVARELLGFVWAIGHQVEPITTHGSTTRSQMTA